MYNYFLWFYEIKKIKFYKIFLFYLCIRKIVYIKTVDDYCNTEIMNYGK